MIAVVAFLFVFFLRSRPIRRGWLFGIERVSSRNEEWESRNYFSWRFTKRRNTRDMYTDEKHRKHFNVWVRASVTHI